VDSFFFLSGSQISREEDAGHNVMPSKLITFHHGGRGNDRILDGLGGAARNSYSILCLLNISF
jgi:hypothetical protein